MDANAIVSLCVAVFTLIVTIVGCFVWISSKIEKVNESIHKLAIDLEKKVSHEVCHTHRENCPCVKNLNAVFKGLATHNINITPVV